MPNKVPAKNVGLYMIDVRKPGFAYSKGNHRVRLNLSHIPLAPLRKRRTWYSSAIKFAAIFIGIGLISLVFIGFFNLEKVKAIFTEKGARILENFAVSLEAFRGFDFGEAEKGLTANDKELSSWARIFGAESGEFSLRFFTDALPILKDAGATLRGVASLNINLLKFAQTLDDIKTNGFHYFQSDGKAFLDGFRTLRVLLHAIMVETQSVRNAAANLEGISDDFVKFNEAIGERYVVHLTELRSLDNFLGAFENAFAPDEDRNIALLFNNPSEMRPGGGFLGSYGVLSVRGGQMSNLEVGDIYWPDHPTNFTAKIIPPEPLQSVTKDWGARDANWFFDFPTSAETVIGFLEKSKIYEEGGVKFYGAIAININVLESIIRLVGPVELADYGLEINENNFLGELQREVEAGRDKKPGQNPKKILGVLAPILLDRISNLSDEGKVEFFEALRKHMQKKDIMFFSRNKEIALFLRDADLDGSVYELPSSFWGAYFAVVNANIAGGKSDAFVKEKIEARVDVDSEGGAFVNLSVTRTHGGQNEKDPWWRATNKDFLQVFTNPGSLLGFIKGNDAAAKITTLDYSGAGYEKLPALEAIEATRKNIADYNAWAYDAFGKRVYATWLSLPAGKSKTLELRYELPRAKEITLTPGKKYRVVFDRQSGTQTSLRVAVNAPLGYRWVESQSPVYIFESDNPDRRVIINITLTR